MLNRRSVRGIAVGAIGALVGAASADYYAAVEIGYEVTAADFGGASVTTYVVDVYLLSDDAWGGTSGSGDTLLNVYNWNTVGGAASYFQSFTGTGWVPTNLGGPFDTEALQTADSFVTIGGIGFDALQAPGTGAGVGVDPNFGGNNAPAPGVNAGWYTSSPPSFIGGATDIQPGVGVLIGRFSSLDGAFTMEGSRVTVTWNQGLGTPGRQQAFIVGQGTYDDCDNNGVPDADDISSGEAADCNSNGIPDYCDWYYGGDPDCNGNRVPDSCDIASDPSLDCDENGRIDGCELADGTAADCNSNGIIDACDVADGTATDCDDNGVLDSCELADGTAVDCNDNGVIDACDISSGASSDYNTNGVPDECEALSVPGDFETIADAISGAAEGSVVFVAAGFYEQPVVLDRAVAIVAPDGPGSTKLDGSKTLGPVVIVDNAPEGAVLAGFTIRAGDPSGDRPMGGGIVGIDSYATIADCVIVGNTGMEGGGVRFEGGYPAIVGCEIRNNLSYGKGGGVYAEGGFLLVSETTLAANIALQGVGHAIGLIEQDLASIEGCSIVDHTAAGSVVHSAASAGVVPVNFGVLDSTIANNAGTAIEGGFPNVYVMNCLIENNGGDGVSLASGSWHSVDDSVVRGNGGTGLVVATGLDSIYSIAGNTICGNAGGALDGLDPADLHGAGNIVLDDRCPDLVVPDDADTIQLAIETSIDGERIVVRPGEYDEVDLDLLGRDIELISSEGRDTTIINGNLVVVRGEPATTLIRGFTVRNGDGYLVPVEFNGGGLNISGSSPTIESCRFTENQANAATGAARGGGVYVLGGQPVIRDTDIVENRAEGDTGLGRGGGIYLAGGILTLERVLVSGNSIALAAENRGGGVYVESGAELVLMDTTICDNVRENLANFGTVSDQGGNTICIANDCDENGVEDASDIGDLGRPDCDGNLIPDDCDIADGAVDCDEDGILDECELADGTAPDINQNGVHDACEDVLVFQVPSTFPTIAEAFAVAPDGSVIGLDHGTYTEPIDFADRNLIIRGDLDDPAAVIIDGSAAPASILTFTGGQTAEAGLEGLTITGGMMGTPLPGQPTSLVGGAVFSIDTSPRFVSVIFRDNVAGFGAGVYALRGAPTFEDCVFTGNFATTDGGSVMLFDSNAVVNGCVFELNEAVNDGGAVKVVRGLPLIANCEMTANESTEGGAVYYFSEPGSSPLRIEGTSISGNTARKFGGGIKARFGMPGFEIVDSTICDNEPDNIVGDYEDLGGNDLCVCKTDLNGDGLVNGIDLGLYLSYQSACNPGEYCPIDFDGDGVITGGDLGLLLGTWGLCD